MNTVTITIDKEGAEPQKLELDIDFSKLSMRESVWLEKILGADTFTKLAEGQGLTSPSVIQALLYVKLKTRRPDLQIDDFDVDLEELNLAVEADAPEGNEDPKVEDE